MQVNIADKKIGRGCGVFIIAELSCNHLQSFDLAVETIQAISEAGADSVKLQTFTPDTITIDSDKDYFQIKQGTLWDGRTLYQLYQEAQTPWEWHSKLKSIAEELGLIFFSSPFDLTAVDFLETLNIPAYKIASFEITDIPLIEYVASKGRPVFISTGIAMLCDIEEAINACRRMGNEQVILMKCTSSYPAPVEESNLRAIPTLEKTFNTPVGLSDHTLGITVPIASVALGAGCVEKHFILRRSLGGHDAAFSLEPEEFGQMVKAVRETEKALGSGIYELTEKSKKNRDFSRSLFVVRDMKEGETFTSENVRSIRPGYGLHPKHLKEIIGRKAKHYIEKGTPLSWEMINE
ncbi:MAG: pseudaminic acid synthase [Nitrospirota bacterium]